MDFTRRSSIMILVWIADFVSKYVLSDILSLSSVTPFRVIMSHRLQTKWCSSTPRPEGWLMNLDDGLSETATKWLVRPMIRNKTEQFGRLPIKSRNFLYLAVPNIFRAFPPALSASSINRINIW